MPGTPRLAVLACMEARLPVQRLYANQGGAHVVRNVGGEATIDAVRSLVLCRKCDGIERIVVLGRTNCRLLGHTRPRQARLAQPSRERRGPIDASIRIAMGVGGETSPEELLREADVALYAAKREGRDRFVFFAPHMDEEVTPLQPVH